MCVTRTIENIMSKRELTAFLVNSHPSSVNQPNEPSVHCTGTTFVEGESLLGCDAVVGVWGGSGVEVTHQFRHFAAFRRHPLPAGTAKHWMVLSTTDAACENAATCRTRCSQGMHLHGGVGHTQHSG